METLFLAFMSYFHCIYYFPRSFLPYQWSSEMRRWKRTRSIISVSRFRSEVESSLCWLLYSFWLSYQENHFKKGCVEGLDHHYAIDMRIDRATNFDIHFGIFAYAYVKLYSILSCIHEYHWSDFHHLYSLLYSQLLWFGVLFEEEFHFNYIAIWLPA